MKPETPAEGIMLTRNFPDAKFYTVECNCGNPDDSIDFVVELDSTGFITVVTSTKQKTHWWKDSAPYLDNTRHYRLKSFLNGLLHRLTVTWKIWTRGYVEYSQETIMTRQQALNYATVIQSAIAELESLKNKET